MDEYHGAIYDPPTSDMPYLVVTVSGERVVAQPVKTRAEARVLLSRERLTRKRARERGHGSVNRASEPT